jgi:TPR repeat protein
MEKCNAIAQLTLGLEYHKRAIIFLQNIEEAIIWLKLAAVQGNLEAHFLLGTMYF